MWLIRSFIPFIANLTPPSKSHKKWESYISNSKLSQNEKVNLIQENIKAIEEKALRKEELIQQTILPEVGLGYEQQSNEVNDMLIDAIKAKLELLDQIR